MTPIHYLLFIPPTLLGGWYLGSKLGASFNLKNSTTRKKFIFWSIILVFFTINVCLLTPGAVIFLYTVMFYLIYDLTIWIAKKANAKSLIKFIKRISMGGVTFILLATTYTLYGVYKAKSPVITDYTITVNKEIKNNGLTIMLLSDLHLGTGSDCDTIDYIVEKVNKTNADIFLICFCKPESSLYFFKVAKSVFFFSLIVFWSRSLIVPIVIKLFFLNAEF